MGKAADRKVVLTDRALKALKPAAAGKRYWVWDATTPHLGVRVTDKGHRSFVVVRRRPGDEQPYNHLLGSYPAVSLADARRRSTEALASIVKGVTPAEVERDRLRAVARDRRDTFEGVADEFIKRHVSKLRTAREVENLIRRELIARWGALPAKKIGRRDVIELLDEIVDRGTPYAAHHTLAAARKLFNWALQRDAYGLEHNPCSHINARDQIGKPEDRERVLTDDELRILWKATGDLRDPKNPQKVLNYPFGPVVRLLMLNGQRRNEIASARRDEIDRDAATLTVPPERMKAKKAHTVPLTPEAMRIIDGLPVFADRDRDDDAKEHGPYIFTTTAGARPVSGFDKMKRRLDKRASELANEAGVRFAPYRLHDLRRTVRTRLSTLGVLPMVAEMVIGHTQTGIHKVYDLHKNDGEKRDALQRWEKLLMSIVEPPPDATAKKQGAGKVIAMRKRARA
jgi:integrase